MVALQLRAEVPLPSIRSFASVFFSSDLRSRYTSTIEKSQVDLTLVVPTVLVPNSHQPSGQVNLPLTHHSNLKVSVDASSRVLSLATCLMQVDDGRAHNLNDRLKVIEGGLLLVDDQYAKFCRLRGKKPVRETNIMDSLLDMDMVERKNSTTF
ncbi:hypothetical protein ACH5RR_025988 [Cinchona calisaya]|uniref:Uncharacterized protein n=1 Tax=Cinchona calisaya TaxID=153742 RepID=A0ABD2Z1K8_9GENT